MVALQRVLVINLFLVIFCPVQSAFIPKMIQESVFSSPRFADFIPAPSLPWGRPCSHPARNSPPDCFSRRGSLLSFKQGSASRASFRLDKICEFGFENSRFFNLFGYTHFAQS